MKYLLKTAFVGTAYCGWQVQKNGVSVQQTIQDAAERVFGIRPPVTGCSRTDSGVHARAFYCTVDPQGDRGSIPTGRLPEALNRYLPDDIAVSEAAAVPDGFHPRYDATGKEYEYLILDRRERDPFFASLAFHHCRASHPLDVAAMDAAASLFCGRHDFRAFMASGSSVTDTVRTVSLCRVVREGDMVTVRVRGDGFLYNMVRIIAGTLTEVGEGRRTAGSVAEAIESRNRVNSGQTLPACGLYLSDVFYPKEIKESMDGCRNG